MPMGGGPSVRICGWEQSRGRAVADKRTGSVKDHGLVSDGRVVLMSGNPLDASVAKPRRNRASVKAADRKSARADGRTKATLLLPDSVDFRLTTIAASLKSDRSTLAAQLIDAGLRRFALDAALRQHAGSEAAAEAEGAGEGAG